MKCLIKIYDRDPLNNLMVIFAFKPQNLVILYDKNDTNIEKLKKVGAVCKKKIPYLTVEYIKIDKERIDEVFFVCKELIHKNPDCYFDITGGGEIPAIGIYLACRKNYTPLFKIDIIKERFINVYGCKHLERNFSLPKLSMDTLFEASGAAISGFNHPTPCKGMDDSLIQFCEYTFKDTQLWKNLCLYLQKGINNYPIDRKSLLFSAPKKIDDAKMPVELDNFDILKEANRLELITGLSIKESSISFSFKNEIIKKYMTDYGSWVEVYSYLLIKRSGAFHDVKMSVKIDWDGKNKNFAEVVNEIDVTCFYKIHPVFISCKLSEPSSEALQELSIYPSYFGGKLSKCVLITLASIKKDRSPILRRAKDMNIIIIDGNAIKNGNLADQIEQAINMDYR